MLRLLPNHGTLRLTDDDDECKGLERIAFVLQGTFIRFRHPIMLLRYADNRIVNIMKVYIETCN